MKGFNFRFLPDSFYLTLLFLSILCSMLFMGACSPKIELLEPESQFFKVCSKKNIVAINDSTKLQIITQESLNKGFKVHWEVSKGEVIGDNLKAIFVAPNVPCIVTVRISIDLNNLTEIHLSYRLVVYKQLVFLKADDFIYTPGYVISTSWFKFFQLVKKYDVKASLGIIGKYVENGNKQFFVILRDLIKTGKFELWNHGYTHQLSRNKQDGNLFNEFYNTPTQEQISHLNRVQEMARQQLGVTLHTFGAPGNSVDINTLVAVETIPELKVWYFGLEGFNGLILRRTIEAEYGGDKPDFDRFVQNYNPKLDYMVLQLHPGHWRDEHFAQFSKIIEFLKQKKVTFLNPYEYYQLLYPE